MVHTLVLVTALMLASLSLAADSFAALDARRISEVELLLPPLPHGFGPNYHDRAAFDALRKKPPFASLIGQAEKLQKQDYPEWSDDLYLDFSKTGQRPRGEKMLAARRDWLPVLVWAECLENRGRFVPTIEMVVRQLCTQRSWTLPAHDRLLGNFKGTAYEVDLASSAFAHDLAQALYMLDDKISAETRRIAMEALHARVFGPVLASLRTGKGHWWLTSNNNWNAVCLAGVTGAALTILPDRRERAIFAAAAEHYSRYFVNGFTADGYCTEGLGYYNYGFGNFILLREKLWQETNGKIDLFSDPKIRKMALYGPNIEILSGVSPAIADCHFGTRVDSQILWYCSRTLGLGLRQYEALDFARPGSPAHAAMLTFANSASQAKPSEQKAAGTGLRSYFDAAGVLICRPAPGGRLGAALKGGNNNENHNHNDVGSFTLALGSEQPMGDPGGPHTYTADTFGPLRYTKFQIFRSRTHPVPLVASREQRAGKEAAAKILRADFSDAADEFVMDIASAYEVPELKKLTRSFTFSRTGAGALVVRDAFDFTSPQSFEVSLTTHGKWKQLGPGQIAFQSGAETVTATIEAPAGWEISAETIEDNAPSFTRIGIKSKAPMQKGSLTVTFAPVGEPQKPNVLRGVADDPDQIVGKSP